MIEIVVFAALVGLFLVGLKTKRTNEFERASVIVLIFGVLSLSQGWPIIYAAVMMFALMMGSMSSDYVKIVKIK